MTKQYNARDWQKDMQRVKDYEYSKTLVNVPVFLQIPDYEPEIEILGYWLQQAKAERERAERAEAEAEKWRIEAFRKYPTPEAYDAACAALHKHRERADKAEEREQKLNDAISSLIDYGYRGKDMEEYFYGVMRSLYPAESEGTK